MPTVSVPNSFTAHTDAVASQVNANFQAILDALNNGLGSDNLTEEAVYGNIVSATASMSGGEIDGTTSQIDIPGCTYTAPATGTFLCIGSIESELVISSGFLSASMTGLLAVNGVNNARTLPHVLDGTGSSGLALASTKVMTQVWRVSATSGQIIKLRITGLGDNRLIPAGTQLTVMQVG